jgi:hypothetical protein
MLWVWIMGVTLVQLSEWASLMLEIHWYYSVHKAMKTWDPTTSLTIWQFQTSSSNGCKFVSRTTITPIKDYGTHIAFKSAQEWTAHIRWETRFKFVTKTANKEKLTFFISKFKIQQALFRRHSLTSVWAISGVWTKTSNCCHKLKEKPLPGSTHAKDDDDPKEKWTTLPPAPSQNLPSRRQHANKRGTGPSALTHKTHRITSTSALTSSSSFPGGSKFLSLHILCRTRAGLWVSGILVICDVRTDKAYIINIVSDAFLAHKNMLTDDKYADHALLLAQAHLSCGIIQPVYHVTLNCLVVLHSSIKAQTSTEGAHTVRWSNFDCPDPKMGVFLQSTEATPCGRLLKWKLTPENPHADTMFMAAMAIVLPWKIVEDFQSFVKSTKLWPSL